MLRSEELEIVPATSEDVSAIRRIARITWAATYAGIIPDDVQRELLERWYSSESLEETINSGGTIFLLGKAAVETVGFAQAVQISPAAATLARIYVLPEHQNQKIGSRLLEAAIAKLKSAGVLKLLVNVERDNETGRRFYARKAFAEISESMLDLPRHQIPVVLCERNI